MYTNQKPPIHIAVAKSRVSRLIHSSFGMKTTTSISTLCHYGVLGMRWGHYKIDETDNGSGRSKIEAAINAEGIYDPDSGCTFYLSEGTTIRNPHTFAGKGTSHPLNEDVQNGLAERYGGSPSNWQHRKGDATVNNNGEDYDVEVHWFQEETAGIHVFRIKT